MYLSNEDKAKLMFLATPAGEDALMYLAQKLWEYYSQETVYSDGDLSKENKGAAKVAQWLKKLPEGLKNAVNATQPTNMG